MRTRHLVAGAERHGVVRHALEVCRAGAFPRVHVPRPLTPSDLPLLLDLLPGAGPVHLHVTDRLLGGPEAMTDLVRGLAAHRPLSATLHDLPQASDGPVNQPRRGAAYAEVARLARTVVVASRHEVALLDAAAGRDCGAVVVPLPVQPRPAAGPPPGAVAAEVALLGWVYPGKGHAQALAAMAGLPPEVGLTVLGGASPGHEDLLDGLRAAAGAVGRRCTVTGWVPDRDLDAALRQVAVPLAAHQHVSASGSVGSWLSAGRRPLVPRSPWAEELAVRLPGALHLYDDLAPALARAWTEPGSTWLAPGQVLGPSLDEVARRYAEVLP